MAGIKADLRELKELLDDGLIDEDEFRSHKAELLREWRAARAGSAGSAGSRSERPEPPLAVGPPRSEPDRAEPVTRPRPPSPARSLADHAEGAFRSMFNLGSSSSSDEEDGEGGRPPSPDMLQTMSRALDRLNPLADDPPPPPPAGAAASPSEAGSTASKRSSVLGGLFSLADSSSSDDEDKPSRGAARRLSDLGRRIVSVFDSDSDGEGSDGQSASSSTLSGLLDAAGGRRTEAAVARRKLTRQASRSRMTTAPASPERAVRRRRARRKALPAWLEAADQLRTVGEGRDGRTPHRWLDVYDENDADQTAEHLYLDVSVFQAQGAKFSSVLQTHVARCQLSEGPAAGAAPPPLADRLTLVVVEDDPDRRALVQAVLRHAPQWELTLLDSPAELWPLLTAQRVDALGVGLRLLPFGELQLLPFMQRKFPAVHVSRVQLCLTHVEAAISRAHVMNLYEFHFRAQPPHMRVADLLADVMVSMAPDVPAGEGED